MRHPEQAHLFHRGGSCHGADGGDFALLALEVLHSEAETLSHDFAHLIFNGRRSGPLNRSQATGWNPSATGEIIRNGAAGIWAGIIGYVHAATVAVHGNQLDVTVIASRCAARELSNAAVAHVNQNAAKGSAVG